MMKICEILEMNNIEKGQPIELNDEHKNSIFFLKRGSVKIVNTTYVTVKYVVKRGNIFGLRIQKLERRFHDLLYKYSTTRIREFRRVWLD